MSTTVRITDEDKDRLHRVQRRLTDLTGKRMTIQRIVGLMTEHAEAEPEHLAAVAWTPPGRAVLDRFLALADAHGGWEGSADEIDDLLYGRG